MVELAPVLSFPASDGHVLTYRHYTPTSPVRGRVVYIHGIQSHSGWYGASCRHLADAGYEVFFLDRRGSGTDNTARGDTPSVRRLLKDIAEFITTKCPQPPILLAVSWGGKLGVALERFHPGTIAALGLLAPGLSSLIRPSLGQRLRIALSRLLTPGKHFPIPLDDPELFTGDPTRQKFIREDPLALRTATARLLVASVILDIAVRRARHDVKVPVLLMLAGKDRIIDNTKTRQFVKQFPIKDVQVLEYPQAHHTLEFEPNPLPIFTDLVNWLDAKSTTA